MTTTVQAPARTPARKTGRVVLVSGVLLLAAIIAVVVHLSQGQEFAELLRKARPGWLFVALALQGGTYVCAAGVWHRALARQGEHRPLLNLIALGLAKVFMDQAVPSAGISGTMLVARALRRRGLSHRKALGTVLAGLIAFYIAYALAVFTAEVILWSTGRVNRLVSTAATLFALVVVLIPSSILWMTRKRRTRFPRWLRRIGPLKNFLTALGENPSPVIRNPLFLVEATILQLGIIVLDAATLGALLVAVGASAAPASVFTAFTMGSVVATVSPIPGGLGTFDGTVIAMLRAFRVPLEPALAATVLLRGYTLLLPLLPGFWLARSEAK